MITPAKLIVLSIMHYICFGIIIKLICAHYKHKTEKKVEVITLETLNNGEYVISVIYNIPRNMITEFNTYLVCPSSPSWQSKYIKNKVGKLFCDVEGSPQLAKKLKSLPNYSGAWYIHGDPVHIFLDPFDYVNETNLGD